MCPASMHELLIPCLNTDEQENSTSEDDEARKLSALKKIQQPAAGGAVVTASPSNIFQVRGGGDVIEL